MVVATVAIAALVVFVILPPRIEAGMNRVTHPPPYPASERARELHARLRVVDLHADTLLWDRDLLARGTRGHVDVPRLIEGNVAIQAFTIVTKTPRHQNIEANGADSDNITLLAIAEAWPPRTWANLVERALYQAARLEDAARRSSGRLTLLRTRGDLRAYLERRKQEPAITAAFLGVEGAHALEGKLDNLDRLFDAGVRMMAPTHFTDNDLGGSASGLEKGGLTDKGRELVRRMEEKRMIVDLAHASASTIDDVLSIATRPVVVSHTGVRGTCDNARNLSDAALRGIAKNGGVVGIGFWTHAVCTVDPPSIARAILHAIDVAGVDHVSLGSDFDGTTLTPFDASGLAQLTEALLDAGLDEAAIAKVMGENTIHLLEAGLPD